MSFIHSLFFFPVIKNISTTFIIFIVTIIFSSDVSSQNLVPNPSFEHVNVCETYHVRCSREGWKNERGGKPKYQESTKAFKAHKGETFAFIKVWHKNHKHARQWMQARLICPLKKGAKYEVKLFVKPRYYSLTNLGISFSDTAICDFTKYYEIGQHYVSPLTKVKPSISFNDSSGLIHYQKNLFTKKIDWLELTDTFTANGTEQYIFIGNFQPFDAIEPNLLPDKGHRSKSLYLIDNVSLTPLDSSSIRDCDYEANLKAIYNDNVRHYCPDGNEGPANISDSTNDFMVGRTFIMDDIQFKFDSDTLVKAAFSSLDSLVNYLAKHKDFALLIKGHTDSVGSSQYNIDLSKDRANAVKQYLVSQGIDSQRLTAKGYGYTKPIASNDTPEGRKKNRRVEFLIIRME